MHKVTAAIALAPALLCAGCHGLFLGEDYQAEDLPHRTVNMWPLVETEEDPASGATKTEALGGLVYHHAEPEAEASHSAAFPFFWSSKVGDTKKAVAPPFYWREREGEASSTTLWPLFHRDSDESRGRSRTSVLSELVSVGSDDEQDRVDVSAPRGVVEVHREGDDLDLWLLGYRQLSLARYKREGTSSSAHLFPVLFHWTSGDEATPRSSWAVLPLGYATSQGDETQVLALPGVYYHREGARKHVSLLGLIADHESDSAVESSATSVLGLGPVALAHYRSDHASSYGHLFPFVFHKGSEQGSVTMASLLYWRFEDPEEEQTRTVLFPLFHRRSSPSESRTDVLYPLFHREREGEARNHWSVLGVAARWTREAEDAYDFRVLWKLFRAKRDGARTEVAFNPLFTDTRDEERAYHSLSVLGFLYRYERKGDERSHRFLHFLKIG